MGPGIVVVEEAGGGKGVEEAESGFEVDNAALNRLRRDGAGTVPFAFG